MPRGEIERIEITDRAAWLALRRKDVTASRVGALFGQHPYVTALKLYLEHSGIEFPEQESTVMRRGRLLEPSVRLAVLDERPEWHITKNDHYYRDPELRLGATPDFLIEGGPRGLGVLQTKTAAPHVFARDWESGKVVPFWITLQTLTEMMLTGATFGAVAVMVVEPFDLPIAILDIEHHAGAEARIVAAVEQFWLDVAAGREPPPDYGRDADLIPYLMPRAAKDKVIDLSGDNELPSLLDQRARLMEMVKGSEARIEEIETVLRFKLADAERATGINGYSVTWKNQHREQFTVPPKDFRVLRVHKLNG